MHTHNLYRVDDLTAKFFQDLIALLITASGLPKTPDVHQVDTEKCHESIETAAQYWKEEGVLCLDDLGELAKSPDFKSLWDSAAGCSRSATSSPEQDPAEVDPDDVLKMPSRSSILTRRRSVEESPLGKVSLNRSHQKRADR